MNNMVVHPTNKFKSLWSVLGMMCLWQEEPSNRVEVGRSNAPWCVAHELLHRIFWGSKPMTRPGDLFGPEINQVVVKLFGTGLQWSRRISTKLLEKQQRTIFGIHLGPEGARFGAFHGTEDHWWRGVGFCFYTKRTKRMIRST